MIIIFYFFNIIFTALAFKVSIVRWELILYLQSSVDDSLNFIHDIVLSKQVVGVPDI